MSACRRLQGYNRPPRLSMATLGDVATKARALTGTDINSYTDANLLIDINIWYQKIVSMILDSMDSNDFDDYRSTSYPIATRLLAARRDYSFSQASWTILGREGGSSTSSQALLPLKIKRVDISYNGSTYYKAEMFDDGTFPYGFGNDTDIDSNFVREAPRYDIKFNSIFVYPLPTAADVTAGATIRLEFERTVAAFTASDYSSVITDSTVIPGFDALFHMTLAWGAAFELATARNLPTLGIIAQQLQDWENRLRTAYGRKNLDARLTLGADSTISYK